MLQNKQCTQSASFTLVLAFIVFIFCCIVLFILLLYIKLVQKQFVSVQISESEPHFRRRLVIIGTCTFKGYIFV